MKATCPLSVFCLTRKSAANLRNRQASAKLETIPSDARIAPALFLLDAA